MNNTRVIVALDDRYDEIVGILEEQYSLTSNMSSQDSVIDAITKLNPLAVITYDKLPGSRTFREWYFLMRENFPNVKLILLYDDASLLLDYLSNRREIPSYFSDSEIETKEAESTLDELPSDDQEDDESVEEPELPNQKAPMFPKKKKKRPLSDREWYEHEDEVSLFDWKLASDTTLDLYEYEQKIVAVTSASGGVGKTDLSINLAVHAATNWGLKTCLIGCNLQNDDVAGRLGLEYLRGKQLTAAFELYLQKQLYAHSLEDCMQDYKGLHVLVGTQKAVESQDMDEDFFKRLLAILKPNYDLIIVDTENNSYSPAYYSVLENADNILVVCTTHDSVLSHIVDELHEWKDDFDISLSKVDMILNKAGEGGFIGVDEIERNTHRDVIAKIPWSKDVLKGSERTKPAVLVNTIQSVKIKREMDKILFRLAGLKNKTRRLKPAVVYYRKWVSNLAKDVKKKLKK